MSFSTTQKGGKEGEPFSRQSTMKATRVPHSTPRTFGSSETAAEYHPLSDLGPHPDSSASHLSYHSPNVVSPLNPSSLPHSGPAQLLMSRLYNKPENSDVLLNVRRQEQMRLRGTGGPNMVGRTSTFWVIHHSCFDTIHNFQKFEKVQKIDNFRYAVSTGPSTCGHMISPLGHLVLHSTGPDWPHKFKSCFADIFFFFQQRNKLEEYFTENSSQYLFKRKW